MKPINAWELGGTLFVPSTHKHLVAIAEGEKFPLLRSIVIDTEDGILESDLENGLKQIQTLLTALKPAKLLRFIRPRNPETLRFFLACQGIEQIDGFVLPKFGLTNIDPYLELLDTTSFHFMPSIEGSELFNPAQLATLRDQLLPYRSRIPVIRFGAEDMLKQLGLRRDCHLSLFDMCVPSYVIASLISTFKPYGFEISGGVYRCFKDDEGLKRDVARDMREGLVGKTIIHPDQIKLIEECYRVTPVELQEAEQLLNSKSAIFSLNETMAEVTTQSGWAKAILLRHRLFGCI